MLRGPFFLIVSIIGTAMISGFCRRDWTSASPESFMANYIPPRLLSPSHESVVSALLGVRFRILISV